jgi:hypothetical protein
MKPWDKLFAATDVYLIISQLNRGQAPVGQDSDARLRTAVESALARIRARLGDAKLAPFDRDGGSR